MSNLPDSLSLSESAKLLLDNQSSKKEISDVFYQTQYIDRFKYMKHFLVAWLRSTQALIVIILIYGVT